LVDFDSQAGAAADHLENCQWPLVKETESIPRTASNQQQAELRKENRPYKDNCDTSPFTVVELRAIIPKMMKNNACGPDDIPIAFFKWFDDDNLTTFLDTINCWWRTGVFPDEKLQAHTAFIHNKGYPQNQENYRPISLLNSCYKINASPPQTRIAAAIDRHLMKTQYGFRKPRSTIIPLACIRRLCERSESSNEEMHLFFSTGLKPLIKFCMISCLGR
jgi:hypothetical protein